MGPSSPKHHTPWHNKPDPFLLNPPSNKGLTTIQALKGARSMARPSVTSADICRELKEPACLVKE